LVLCEAWAVATTFQVSEILADIAVHSNCPPFTASTRVTDTQATYWLAQSVRSLSALLRQHRIEDRELLQVATPATVANVKTVALQANTGEVHAVLWARGANDYVLLGSAQQDDLAERSAQGWDQVTPRWRLEGETLAFYPTPVKVHSLEVFYTNHVATPLGATVQMRLDCDRWLTLDVCMKVATSKRQPTGEFQQQKALLENDLLSRGRERDVQHTDTIRDVRAEALANWYRQRMG
jgi:hypothetical protein